MNKNKKIIGLLALLTFTVSLTAPLAAMENKNENAPKKLLALELLRKKQEENKEKFGGDDEKNGGSKIEKQEDQNDVCAICQDDLKTHPSIILHTAEGATKYIQIDHAYHIGCIWNWLQANNNGTPVVTDLASNLNSKKRIKIGCPLCGNQEFEVELGKLCTKYSTYLSTLTLAEKFENLEHLPTTAALALLKELAKLDQTGLSVYGGKTERNLKIQKVICSRFITDGAAEDVTNRAINAALNIIGEDPVCKEFALEIRDGLTQEEFIDYFKRAFDCDDYCVIPLKKQFSDYDPVIDTDKINVDNRNDVLKYESIAEFYRLCQKKLPEDLQVEYYKNVLNAYTPSSEQKESFIKNTFGRLPAQAKISVFDETYQRLSNSGKANILAYLKKQLLENKGKDTVAKMVCTLCQNTDPRIAAQLLEKFWDELSSQDRFAIFSHIFDNCFTGFDEVWTLSVKMVGQRLEETKLKPYLEKVALFLLAYKDCGILRQNMLRSLLSNEVPNGLYTFYHLYDLLLENHSLANRDLFCRICYMGLTSQPRSAEEFTHIIGITLKHITSPQLKSELLKKGLEKLPKNCHATIILNYLHASEEDKELTALICALVHKQGFDEKLNSTINLWPKLPKNKYLDGLKALGIFFNMFSKLSEFIKIKEWLPQHTINTKCEIFEVLWLQQPNNCQFNYQMILDCCKNEDEKKEFSNKANSLQFAANFPGTNQTTSPKKDVNSCGINLFKK